MSSLSTFEPKSDKIELDILSIVILKFVIWRSNAIPIVRIKSSLHTPILFNIDQFNESINTLKNKEFIEANEANEAIATEPGKQFMANYDLYGKKEVFASNLKLAIIKFLYQLNDKIPLAALPGIFQLHAPEQTGFSNEYNLMHYLEFNNDIKGYIKTHPNHVYELSLIGKVWYENEVGSSADSHKKFISYCDSLLKWLCREDIYYKAYPLDEILSYWETTGIQYDVKKIIETLQSTNKIRTEFGPAYGPTNEMIDLFRFGKNFTVSFERSVAPIQHFHTHGDYSPIATGGNLKIETKTIKNEENEEAKELAVKQIEDLSKNRWYRHWSFILLILSIIAAIGIPIAQTLAKK